MTTSVLCRIILILSILTIMPSIASAAWVEDGIELCTAAQTQSGSRAIPDGYGGAIIAWLDHRSGSSYDVYAQRIDRWGNEMWTAGGLGIITTAGTKSDLRIVTDGEGGAILGWRDYRNGNMDIFTQRIDSDGSSLWTAGGVAVCVEVSYQYDMEMTSDGFGGAIFAWDELRQADYDIYAQAVDANGTVKWTNDGVLICGADLNQFDPRLVHDGNGGAVITWYDSRLGMSDYNIYAQRIRSNGSIPWTADGAPVCTEAENQLYPEIARNDWGDFVIVWEDSRNVGLDADIYANALTIDGAKVFAAGDAVIMSNSGNQALPRITPGDGEFVFIIWEDRGTLKIQKFGTSSFGEWGTSTGIFVCTRWIYDSGATLTSDGQGGVFVLWYDDRYGNLDIFAQHFDGDGNSLWDENGIPVSTAPSNQFEHYICSDAEGGLFVSWTDYRNLEYDIYAQRMDRVGYWGYPAPDISSASDVPADQGGHVRLTWERSRVDAWPEQAIEQYSVWRAIDGPAALAAAGAGAAILESAAALGDEPQIGTIRIDILYGEPYYWELVSYQDAYSLETYSETVPTLYDSVEADEGQHYFQVIAHAEDRTVFWVSEPDSGYSVDNLAPAAPLGLAGEQVYSPEGMLLTWEPNIESDLAGYNVYRGTHSGFVPGPESLVTSTPDTLALDGEWTWDAGYWYKVAAVDIHGNESPYAVLSPEEVTGDGPTPAVDATYLSQNWPNPFNPVTTISFGLEKPGHVSLRIYDAAGRLVAVLVDESRPAGRYAESWNGADGSGGSAASGVYFYRLIAGGFDQSRKMILLR